MESFSAARRLYSRTIASLTMSAAVPWMGELTATLCAAVFSVRLLLVMAATRRRRPMRVWTNPVSSADLMVSFRNLSTPWSLSK